MEPFKKEFTESLKTGYIDEVFESKGEYQPQFIFNDKSTGAKVLTTIDFELRNCSEFWFSVAFVTKSGIITVLNTLEDLEKRGIKGKVLVSQYLNFTQPEALKSLLKFKNIELRIVVDEDFHSKGYLFKRENHFNIIIGSSNFTQTALCTNKEWNLKVSATPQSSIYKKTIKEFQVEFNNSYEVTPAYVAHYENIYKSAQQYRKERATLEIIQKPELKPNSMQIEVLDNLNKLRSNGIDKALLISATGTGKTYLSAFEVKQFNAKRVLFIVHRLNIARKAMESYKSIFKNNRTMGIFSGSEKNTNVDFVFSTVQTICKDRHMSEFGPDYFDYIIIDESHRAGANSYQQILNYFNPQFLLGMTATPERTDGKDIFDLFDHNIAGEIRLHRALNENMLSPFHYFGVSDVIVDGNVKDHDYFRNLISEERVARIIDKLNFYGTDNGELRGIVFCSRIEECIALSEEFNNRGFKTIPLSGRNSEKEREAAIEKLESDEYLEKLDLIFTVDIFNEGIDIPKLNTVIMLRPTQSAIIFVQQLGRGLRKIEGKDYLTVIDFIGNYDSNYLVPVALFGDSSYNKDRIRRLISKGNEGIPGSSTVNFDRISKERILKSIDSANMKLKKDLVQDYKLLKHKMGRTPMMMDFIEHGSRDPMLYVLYSDSYYNFVLTQESLTVLNKDEIKLLEFLSTEVNNTIRVEESIILQELVEERRLDVHILKKLILDKYHYVVSDATINSCIVNLNMNYNMTNIDKKRVSLQSKFGFEVVILQGNDIILGKTMKSALHSTVFRSFLSDSINYSIHSFNQELDNSVINMGFILYKKYSRKDVFRVLNWNENPVAQNVGGYILSKDGTQFPIFVNYHKEDDISNSTKYEDEFVNSSEIICMSKNRRNLNSPCMTAVKNYRSGLRIPLFIKKNNDEGKDFFYMGDLTPIDDSFIETTMLDDKNNSVSVVKVHYKISSVVEHSLYEYLTHN